MQTIVLGNTCVRVTTSNAADKTLWDSYFAPANATLPLTNFAPGTALHDIVTGVTVYAIKSSTAPYPIVYTMCSGCTLAVGVAGAAGTTKNRFVKISGAGDTYVNATAAGERVSGIALNDATVGQTVYVLISGKYLVENGGVALAAGANVTTTANGRTQTAVAGNFVNGQCLRPSVVIGATTFDICTFMQLELI